MYDDAHTPNERLTALWQAVLTRALRDAIEGGADRAWARLANPDFGEVCIRADCDPEAVLRDFRAIEARCCA